MKLRVYEKSDSNEKTIYLQLVENLQGSISLIAVDENGKRLPSGILLTVDSKGMYRHYGVAPELGFALDKFQRIEESET